MGTYFFAIRFTAHFTCTNNIISDVQAEMVSIDKVLQNCKFGADFEAP